MKKHSSAKKKESDKKAKVFDKQLVTQFCIGDPDLIASSIPKAVSNNKFYKDLVSKQKPHGSRNKDALQSRISSKKLSIGQSMTSVQEYAEGLRNKRTKVVAKEQSKEGRICFADEQDSIQSQSVLDGDAEDVD